MLQSGDIPNATFEDINLRKINHLWKTNTVWFCFYEVRREVKLIETTNRMAVARSKKKVNGSLVFSGDRVSV